MIFDQILISLSSVMEFRRFNHEIGSGSIIFYDF